MRSKDREVQNLHTTLTKERGRSNALELDLEAAKAKIKKQEEETDNLWDSLDSLEQYTRKKQFRNTRCPERSLHHNGRSGPRNRQRSEC